MMSATLPALVTGLALFGVDKLTKMWAWNTLQDGPEASVPLGLEFFLHTGDHPTWRIILGIAFLAAGVEAVRRKHLSPLAWSLWAAAAAGNLSDLMHRGGVVDFIAVQVGPVKGIFNIADFALYGVAASILVSGLRPRRCTITAAATR